MVGRIRRLQGLAAMEAASARMAQEGDGLVVCPLCERPIPPSERDAHHLVPKSKGGRHTEFLHRICHRQVHALFSETQLARTHHTVEALKEDPDMAAFIRWVKTKPDDFRERTRKSARLKRG